MPYNTRRKSLSLPSLGIALPGAMRPARSPPSSDMQHIAKKQKRSHSGSSGSSPSSPPRLSALRFDDHRPKSQGRIADTPPPSPGADGQRKIDTDGIDDIIVVGVIEQLQKTGNRPHLLKELATVLSPTIPIVESSANPAAIISSRLATYLKRNWTALSRCPLDKKLVGTHPKRVYYFLSTCPHQPIPDDVGSIPSAARIISPSLSSAASEEEDVDSRSRDVRSPSPELDLSDYDDGSAPFSNQPHPPPPHNIAHNRRAQSPPLEKDEREFTQTASALQRRRSQASERERSASMSVDETSKADVSMDDIFEIDETEESAARKNSEIAVALFGQMEHTKFEPDFGTSSPLFKPTMSIEMPPPMFKPGETRFDTIDSDLNWEVKSPENIELDELDDLFGGY